MGGASFMSQGLTDGVKVTLPYPVTIDDVVLQPGEYEIRRPSSTNDQILRFFNNDELRHQTIALTIPAEQERAPEDSKVILHHIGDKYYFDKIWIQGQSIGYEFPLPDRVRALQRELAVTVPATFQSASTQSAPAVAPAPAERPASSPESIAPQAAAPVRTPEQQEPAIQASDARVESTSPVEHQQDVAVLQQQEQRQTPPPAIDSRQSTAPSNQGNVAPTDSRQSPDELPATAAGWLVYVLTGGLLIVAAMLFGRPVKAQG
ncbi:MAG TPA: hypothetical protein VFR18_27465, partial [Terriglobia bacterium]|nr:hypothetical protein [Terriglobia bacterium]